MNHLSEKKLQSTFWIISENPIKTKLAEVLFGDPKIPFEADK